MLDAREAWDCSVTRTPVMAELDNPFPSVKARELRRGAPQTLADCIFDVIRDIRDPEHPHTLEELSVVSPSSIQVEAPPTDSPGYGRVKITFTPTVPHCSLASVIGLSILQKLSETGTLAGKGEHYHKLTVECEPGSHTSAADISKQLADKERVSAAFENPRILSLLRECVSNLP